MTPPQNDPLAALEKFVQWFGRDAQFISDADVEAARAEIDRVRALIENIQALAVSLHRNGNDHLMDYDGDNHGDTAEAAHNRCSECCAAELDKLLVDLGVKP